MPLGLDALKMTESDRSLFVVFGIPFEAFLRDCSYRFLQSFIDQARQLTGKLEQASGAPVRIGRVGEIDAGDGRGTHPCEPHHSLAIKLEYTDPEVELLGLEWVWRVNELSTAEQPLARPFLAINDAWISDLEPSPDSLLVGLVHIFREDPLAWFAEIRPGRLQLWQRLALARASGDWPSFLSLAEHASSTYSPLGGMLLLSSLATTPLDEHLAKARLQQITEMQVHADEIAIREGHAAWIQALNTGDLDHLLASMTSDAVFLNPGQPPLGRDGFSATFSNAHRHARIHCTSDLEEVTVVGDLAYTVCRDSLTVALRTGEGETQLAGHRMTVYRRQPDGRWLLARDAHTLTPTRG